MRTQWYHGTSVEAAAAIQRDGFHVQPRRQQSLGVGAYLGTREIAEAYGPALIVAAVYAPICDWQDPLCAELRKECGYPAECSIWMANGVAMGWPHKARRLTAAMRQAGVDAVAYWWMGIAEVCVYNVEVIAVLNVVHGYKRPWFNYW